jgi:hypothetical protein
MKLVLLVLATLAIWALLSRAAIAEWWRILTSSWDKENRR